MAKNLSPKQREFIAEFIKSSNIKDACEKAGVSRQTYYNWTNSSAFSAEIKKQQDKLFEESIAGMKQLLITAVETQKELLRSKSESIRLRAANSIIAKNAKIIETMGLNERLIELEKKVEAHEALNKLENKIYELETKIN